jgi:succinate dehydrogenase flavin-adding protein (antitoxin of CptAB toxin-antitoxin module)
MRFSAGSLQRTLEAQLFTKDNGFYYLRGDAHSACFVAADSPRVSFLQDRVSVHMHVRAKLGTSIHGQCLGISLSRDVDVSLVPEAENETIGFHDARIDKLSGSRELDAILLPFLSHRVPSSLKVDAAEQFRQLLTKSTETTGYPMTLDRLLIHSMSVQGDALVVDVDGAISVK